MWIVLILLAFGAGYLLGRDSYHEMNLFNDEQQKRKQKHLEQVLEYLDAHETITNSKVEKVCGVSIATAGRYLEELETDGKIAQIGRRGKYVNYSRI